MISCLAAFWRKVWTVTSTCCPLIQRTPLSCPFKWRWGVPTLYRCVCVCVRDRFETLRVTTAGLYYYAFNLPSSRTSDNRCGTAFVAVCSSLSSSVLLLRELQSVCFFLSLLLTILSCAPLFSSELYFPLEKYRSLKFKIWRTFLHLTIFTFTIT